MPDGERVEPPRHVHRHRLDQAEDEQSVPRRDEQAQRPPPETAGRICDQQMRKDKILRAVEALADTKGPRISVGADPADRPEHSAQREQGAGAVVGPQPPQDEPGRDRQRADAEVERERLPGRDPVEPEPELAEDDEERPCDENGVPADARASRHQRVPPATARSRSSVSSSFRRKRRDPIARSSALRLETSSTETSAGSRSATSTPLISGSITSRRTRSGRSARAESSAD